MKFLVLVVFFYFNQGAVIGQNYMSYVCNSYLHYWPTRAESSKCYYSGDVFNSFEKLAWSYGYDVLVYKVITEDQYVLNVFRIFPKGRIPVGTPILLQHGSDLSATSFMLLGNQSLAFILVNNGYDVWLGNFRGTTYSSEHMFLKPNDKRFWNFSFHEFGIYDVKAFVNLVFAESKQKVIYLGYSVGTKAYYVYSSMHPREAMEKIQVSISLAATVFMHYNKSPVVHLINLIPYGLMQKVLDALFPDGVFLRKTLEPRKTVLHFCLDDSFGLSLCELLKCLTFGYSFFMESPDRYPVLLGQCMEPTALKNFYHTEQTIRGKEFRQYDYGSQENLKYYGMTIPPSYNLSKIMVPNYIVYSSGDFLAPEEAIKLIYQRLPERAKPFGEPYKVKDEKFSHINFITHRNVKTLLYDHVVEFLRRQNSYFSNSKAKYAANANAIVLLYSAIITSREVISIV